jgi:hypothetical protein
VKERGRERFQYAVVREEWGERVKRRIGFAASSFSA